MRFVALPDVAEIAFHRLEPSIFHAVLIICLLNRPYFTSVVTLREKTIAHKRSNYYIPLEMDKSLHATADFYIINVKLTAALTDLIVGIACLTRSNSTSVQSL